MLGRVIFLIGPRGSGKSSAGSLAASLLGLPLHDTDRMVEAAAGCCIADLVGHEGWEAFRLYERRALEQAALSGGLVATGGGAVLDEENRRMMRGSGSVMYLAAPLAVLCGRLSLEPGHAQRPSLTGEPVLNEMARVMAEREALYLECAHHVIDASRPLERVAEEIARLSGEARNIAYGAERL